MPNNAGFFFDFGVSLPSPTSGGSALFLTNFNSRFKTKADPPQKVLPPSRFSNHLHIDGFGRLFRFEIEFPHGQPQPEVSATPTTRRLVFRRSDSMSAGCANMPILPRSKTVMHLLHSGLQYNIRRFKIQAAPHVKQSVDKFFSHFWELGKKVPDTLAFFT